jgi:hypothetical protein
MSDPYTTEARLCDDEGMVSWEPVTDRKEVEAEDTTYLKRLNILREKTYWARGEKPPEPITEPFGCTGSAHLAGQYIRCTSRAHETIAPEPGIYLDTRAWSDEAAQQRERGRACRRIAREMREAILPQIEDDETAQSVARDLDQIEEVGRWLEHAQILDGNKLGFRVTGLR